MHTFTDRPMKIVTDARLKEKLFKKEIGNVCKECEVCKKYKNASLKSVVVLPLAKMFNHIVCMDLTD